MPVAPALLAERARATFPARALTYLLDGGEAHTRLRESLEARLERDGAFGKGFDYYTQGRAERFRAASRKQRRLLEIAEEMGLSARARRVLRRAAHDDLGTDLQTLMFIPNIRATFSPAQQREWLPGAEAWRIVGAYAQTEMGHGSNVRALETTATFLPGTDEIEIHSPTLTSTKWWPGNLGRSANHAIVYARLLVGGRDFGVHNFMVPLRSMETHLALPGCTIGDIGMNISS
jgi:acyl-CoA oxidase